eukprot:4112610-Pyramimonas_sp.AAC.1
MHRSGSGFVPFQGRGRRLQSVGMSDESQQVETVGDSLPVDDSLPQLHEVEPSEDESPSMKDIEEALQAKLQVAAAWLEE